MSKETDQVLAEIDQIIAVLDNVERIGNEYPDGVHSCEQLQLLEPGRRPCTCGRCPSPPRLTRT